MSTKKLAIGQRLGWSGYVQILAQLQRTPLTAQQIEDQLGISKNNGAKVARAMHSARLTHIASWQTTGSDRAHWRPVWGFGAGPDAQRPGEGKRTWSRANNIAANLLALASVLRALAEPISIEDLAIATGCGIGSVRMMLKQARTLGLVHVAYWSPVGQRGGAPTAMWCLGQRHDAPRPKPKSRREIHAQCWARRRGRLAMQAMIAATGPAGYAGAAA